KSSTAPGRTPRRWWPGRRRPGSAPPRRFVDRVISGVQRLPVHVHERDPSRVSRGQPCRDKVLKELSDVEQPIAAMLLQVAKQLRVDARRPRSQQAIGFAKVRAAELRAVRAKIFEALAFGVNPVL